LRTSRNRPIDQRPRIAHVDTAHFKATAATAAHSTRSFDRLMMPTS
jgi:hypothetical protein